jgi:hypothetical protein
VLPPSGVPGALALPLGAGAPVPDALVALGALLLLLGVGAAVLQAPGSERLPVEY